MRAHAHHATVGGICAACEEEARLAGVLDGLMRARPVLRPIFTLGIALPDQLALFEAS